MYHSRALPERRRRWGWNPEIQRTCRPANWPKADHSIISYATESPVVESKVGWKTIFDPVSLHQLILLYGRYACIDHNWYKWPTRTILISNKPPKKKIQGWIHLFYLLFFQDFYLFIPQTIASVQKKIWSLSFTYSKFFFSHLQSGLDSDPRSKIAFLMNVRH